MADIQYDIRNVPDPDGGLIVELWVEDVRVCTARTSADVLGQMAVELGTLRDEARAFLEETVVRSFKQQLGKVELSPPKQVPVGGLRFVSRYSYRDFETIYSGVVWYDVPSSMTGPENLAAVVRNKMRTEVHQLLTEASPNARGIVDLSK